MGEMMEGSFVVILLVRCLTQVLLLGNSYW